MRKMLSRFWRSLPFLLASAALVHPLAKLGARHDWRLDLITHFQELALILSLLAAASLAFRYRRAAIVMLVLAIFQVEPVFRYEFPWDRAPTNSARPRLRVLFANVLFENSRYASLIDLINESNPDVVAIAEVSDDWVLALSEIAKAYPYRMEVPNGPAGLSLWFKKPPIRIDPLDIPCPGGWPFLHATFAFEDQTWNLWLLHPASPFRRDSRTPGFPELAALADRIAATPGPTIVVGDLNTTDGSPHFDDFLAKTRLRDSRRGFGRQPSWPVGSPYQITIDHALISEDVVVVSRSLGSSIGSDHRPILIDFEANGASDASARSTSALKSSK